MAKTRRKVELPAELLRELEDIDRHIKEHDRRAAETLAKVALFRAKLRQKYALR